MPTQLHKPARPPMPVSQGKPYHISALYVVDLDRFRCAGVALRPHSSPRTSGRAQPWYRWHYCTFVPLCSGTPLAVHSHALAAAGSTTLFRALRQSLLFALLALHGPHCCPTRSPSAPCFAPARPPARPSPRRQMAAGDALRVMYDNLSKDPNSLANLDQVGRVSHSHDSRAQPAWSRCPLLIFSLCLVVLHG